MITRKVMLPHKNDTCPVCGEKMKVHSQHHKRTLIEIGQKDETKLEVHYNKYHCRKCKKYFNESMDYLAEKSSHYTNRVKRMALYYLNVRKIGFRNTCDKMYFNYKVRIPMATLHGWSAEM